MSNFWISIPNADRVYISTKYITITTVTIPILMGIIMVTNIIVIIMNMHISHDLG